MRVLLLISLALVGLPSKVVAQVQATDASFLPTEVDLSLRLDPGQVWRQQVRFKSEITDSSGKLSRWTFEYKLRLRCIDADNGSYSIDGKFVDWLLRLETDECRYEWYDGKFRVDGEVTPPEGDISAGCRSLLYAWSSGLRGCDLRFDLNEDGSVNRLTGLTGLHQKVGKELRNLPENVPQALLDFFGLSGLERADCALSFGLSTIRPTHKINPGEKWNHSCEIGGITEGVCQVKREFVYAGTSQLRRHRFADILIMPEFKELNEKGDWVALPGVNDSEANTLQLLIDSGLTYSMLISLSRKQEDGSTNKFTLESNFVD